MKVTIELNLEHEFPEDLEELPIAIQEAYKFPFVRSIKVNGKEPREREGAKEGQYYWNIFEVLGLGNGGDRSVYLVEER
jgi:hypothetical protein